MNIKLKKDNSPVKAVIRAAKYLIKIYFSRDIVGVLAVKKTRADVDQAIKDARYYEHRARGSRKPDVEKAMKNIKECLEFLAK